MNVEELLKALIIEMGLLRQQLAKIERSIDRLNEPPEMNIKGAE